MTTVLAPAASGSRGVLLFGSGTIGSAVARALAPTHRGVPVGVPWESPRDRLHALRQIGDRLLSAELPDVQSIVWAAGTTGFGSDERDAAAELGCFRDVVGLVGRLHEAGHDADFHVVSSAGGLYEGAAVTTVSADPRPQRAYGRLKLEQELTATTSLPRSRVAIHRPSSVYGFGTGRPGLVGVLVRNGLGGRVTSIVGSYTTLRDYVSAQSVGAHLARCSQRPVDEEMSMLVAGRPTSIREVVAEVERALRRRLYVQFRDAWNASDITFSPGVRARAFAPPALAVGVRLGAKRSLGRWAPMRA